MEGSTGLVEKDMHGIEEIQRRPETLLGSTAFIYPDNEPGLPAPHSERLHLVPNPGESTELPPRCHRREMLKPGVGDRLFYEIPKVRAARERLAHKRNIQKSPPRVVFATPLWPRQIQRIRSRFTPILEVEWRCPAIPQDALAQTTRRQSQLARPKLCLVGRGGSSRTRNRRVLSRLHPAPLSAGRFGRSLK